MSTETKKSYNPPAFPCADTLGNGERFTPLQEGMTLRDYFANSAMQTILKHSLERGLHTTTDIKAYDSTSAVAYSVADAMLKQRENE